MVWLGKINVDAEVAFRWGSLMGEKRIVRSSYGDARPQRDFPWLVEQYLDGRLMLDELITRAHRAGGDQRRLRGPGQGDGTRTVDRVPVSHPPLAPDHIDAPHREAGLGDLRLESGEAIVDYRQSYVTHGAPERRPLERDPRLRRR